MAIKDYRRADYESVDFEINDSGSSAFSIRLYGDHLNYLFADMELYSDSGRTTPLSGADWEYYTTDATYTALEADTGAGGSGKTIYTEIRILNATYQSGTVYATCNNFGSYTSGLSQGVTIEEITATGSVTIDPGEKKKILIIPSSVSTQLTITVVQGTHPCGDASYGNVLEIRNESGYSGYHIITWSGASANWWLEENKNVNYFFAGGSNLMRGPGWNLEYKPSSPPSGNVLATSLRNSSFEDDVNYRFAGVNGSTGVVNEVFRRSTVTRSDSCDESGGARAAILDGTPDYLTPTSFVCYEIWRLYE